MARRQRANTLSIDTNDASLGRRIGRIKANNMAFDESEEHEPQTAPAGSSDPPMATPRLRSHTVVDSPPPWAAFMKPGTAISNTASNGRPLSAMLVDPPDSPSVMGMKGRHRLQKDASHVDRDSIFMRNGRWCDFERKNLAAYEYLCHVSEAKEWIEACIGEELPEIDTLEDSLRNGVGLAKLAKTFCPEAVGKIYQQDSVKRSFKFTDNINFFLQAIRQVKLPRLFHFELTDLYDRKNMPRVIYCVHALSHFLVKMGIAPGMKDLVGHLEFSEAQLRQTQAELDNLGLNVPSFHRIESDIGNRKPRLSRELRRASLEKQGLNPDDIEEEEEEEDVDDDEQEEAIDDDDATEDAADEVVPRGDDSQQDTASDHTRFDGDVSFLDDPDLDRMQKAKLYWEKRIDIVIQFQQSARCRLAERLLEEKRQARRYLCMWESATVMQTYCRMVLGKRVLDGYKAQRDAAIEAERQRIEWEEENRRLAEEAEMTRQLKERAERERVKAEKERAEQEKKRLADEKAEKERLAKEQEAAALERRKRLESERAELERRIVGVQALIRGRLARKLYADMRGWITAITKFQAVCRGYIVREEYGSRLSSWKTVEMGVKKIQALARGYLVRQRLKERRTHLKRNVNVIVKLQNLYRAKLAGKAYRTLTVEDTPPTPKIVQSCASILEDTDQDIEEELDLERHRQLAVRQIRENQQTTRILEQLDIKIALLVRNRISLEEVVRQTSRHFRFLDEMRKPSTIASPSFRNSYSSLALSGVVPANSLYSLKNLDKESRKRLDGYQHLFYLLQTQPTYLARLLFLLNQGGSKVMRQSHVTSVVSANGSGGLNGRASYDSGYPGSPKGTSDDISISKLIETIVLTLFGFAQNAREEYLLLKLLCSAIKIEMDSISNIQEFLRGNPIFIKLAVHYNRGAKERKYLRDLLQPLIRKVLDDGEIDLESDPLVIYRSLIREEESRTGEKSRRQYDVTREVALNDFETRTTFIRHLRQLRTLAEEFVDAILKSLDDMPYGMRYIARELRRALTTKFPDEPEQQVMKVVGHLVYYRYINPAIIAPEMFDVIETTITPLQRKNLGEIAKILNQVSVGMKFNEDNMFLSPLNNHIGYLWGRFLTYAYEVTDVVDPEVKFQMDEFTDLATLHKPSICMTISEIQTMHQALETNLDYIAPAIPEQVKQKFGSYDAVMSIIEQRRKAEEAGDAAEVAGGDSEDTDLVDAIPEGTVLVERAGPDGQSRVLVLEDPLRVVLQDLGKAPRTRSDPYSHYELQLELADRFADDTVTIMSGSSSTSVLAASASQILSDAALSASQAAYSGSGGLLQSAQPTAKEAVHAKAERAAKLHRLFLETKRKWLTILRVQSGTSLLEILERPVTAEDESRWRASIQLEIAKMEERKQRHLAQWQQQWEAQQQLMVLRESQAAFMSSQVGGRPGSGMSVAAPGRSSSPTPSVGSSPTSQGPPPAPALAGEKVVRELASMTFSELKRQVARSMRMLETERWVERTRKSNIGTGGTVYSKDPKPAYAAVFRVRKSDGYQGMLNAIARDIRTKAQRRERRRVEMRRIRTTLLNLKEKSEYLESQRHAYEEYLASCTQRLAKDAPSSSKSQRKMHSVLPFTRQYFHLRDLQRSGRVPRFGSYKYSAEKLYYKGVIISVDGYPPRQLDKISLTISSDEAGVFDVQVSLLGVKMPGGGCVLHMQDLLQLQYDNVQTMTLYEGSVVVNTYLLVYLINKKFYS